MYRIWLIHKHQRWSSSSWCSDWLMNWILSARDFPHLSHENKPSFWPSHKLVWSRWLDMALFFFAFLFTLNSCSIKMQKKKETWTISNHLDQTHTAISRKVVGKHVHATIPKSNMGYDQYTVPDTVAVEPTFVAFL